jgi:hypothetical protein
METKSLELTEIENQYINRPLEEEHLSFEEFEILSNLRKKLKPIELRLYMPSAPKVFKVGDKVWVWVSRNHNKPKKVSSWLGGYSISMEYSYNSKVGGIVEKVHKDGTYDVTSAISHFTNVNPSRIGMRNVSDLSNVIIPEELKNISTDRLLKAYKSSRIHNYFSNSTTNTFINGSYYSPEEVKAELGKREHIYSKDDLTLVRELKSKNK